MEHSDDIAESHNLGVDENMLDAQGKNTNLGGGAGGREGGMNLEEGLMQEALDEY